RTAGGYPYPESKILRQMEWIFEPYHRARNEGLGKLDSKGILNIIDQVGDRITQFANGHSKELPLETAFDVIGGGKNWAFVDHAGSLARAKMAERGIMAYVMQISPGRYSIGRSSIWIPFPVPEIIEELNKAEPPGLITSTNRWGGANTIGGSPRE